MIGWSHRYYAVSSLFGVLTNAAVGDETDTKEVVVKRGEYKENPQSGKVQLVYNEHVELIEVPIKPSDRLKARDMLGKYHKLFIDKHDINGMCLYSLTLVNGTAMMRN